jgi:uncharacterized protein
VGLKPWSLNADGVVLTIRLTPRSARDAIGAIETLPEGRTALIARVRAVPSEGEANAALVRLLARTLGIPPRSIVLAAGASSRLKRLVISGDGPALIAALERLSKTG